MNKLNESFEILSILAIEINNRSKLIVDLGYSGEARSFQPQELTLLTSFIRLNIIDSVSFLDEYDNHFGVQTEKEYKNRIIETKQINKPFYDYIRSWKDLGLMRNQMLAHNLRVGDSGGFIYSIENLSYNSPRTLNDIFLLTNILMLMMHTIETLFEEEFLAKKIVRSIDKSQKNLTMDEVGDTTLKLINAAESISDTKGKKINLGYYNVLTFSKK